MSIIIIIGALMVLLGVFGTYMSWKTEQNKQQQREEIISAAGKIANTTQSVADTMTQVARKIGVLPVTEDPLLTWATQMLSIEGSIALALQQTHPLPEARDYSPVVLLPAFVAGMERDGYTLIGDVVSAPRYGRDESAFAFEGDEGRIVIQFHNTPQEPGNAITDPSGKHELAYWVEEEGPHKGKLLCGNNIVILTDENCDGVCRAGCYRDVQKNIEASTLHSMRPARQNGFVLYRPKNTPVGVVFDRVPLSSTALTEKAFRLSYTETTMNGKAYRVGELVPKLVEAVGIGARVNVLIPGEPGTGKTQLARRWAAMLHAKGAEIVLVEDQSVPLTEVLSALRSRTADVATVLLIEDLQAFSEIELSALANFMEGASSNPKTSVIGMYNPEECTAAVKQIIEEALGRPGRCNVIVRCTRITQEQAVDLLEELKALYPNYVQAKELPSGDVTLAQVWEVLVDKRLAELL